NYRLDGILPVINLIDLPLEDKERVEALKGASALYYGFTAPSGVINMTMKRPPSSPLAVVSGFGNDHGEISGHVDSGNTWGKVGARLNAVRGSVDSGIDHTHGDRTLLATALDLQVSDSLKLMFDGEYVEKNVNEPGVFRYLRVPRPT